MSLPIYTTVEDINSIVNYLRTKPMGATLSEARAVLKEMVEPRKLSAFSFWGIIVKEGERIKLSPRGWDLARKTISQEQALSEVIDSVVPYRSVLEWAHHQRMDSLSSVDTAAHWHEHHSEAAGSDAEKTVKDQAVCFFRIAEAAGLGKFSMGRRGAATRLDLNRDVLQQHIEVGPTAIPLADDMEDVSDLKSASEATAEALPQEDVDKPTSSEASIAQTDTTPAASAPDYSTKAAIQVARVFITHGSNMELVEQVETVLQVAEIDYEVAVKEETVAIPVPDKVFNAMRRCSAAIIIVSAEQAHNESDVTHINPNVLIEIGAAFVLYDRRVVLLWERGVAVPSNLQGLYRCEFEGKELGWAAGMKLMKAIKEFRK